MYSHRLARSIIAIGLAGSLSLTACDPVPDNAAAPTAEAVASSEAAIATPPDPSSREYVQYASTRSGVAERFNYIDFPKGTRSVAITGKTVVFDSADDAGLVERTNDDQDIKTLTIDAQTVVFRRAMHWPSTQVTIRAEEVRFEDVNGVVSKINTEPPAYPDQPPQFTPGKPGLAGGAITVFAKRVVAPGSQGRFYTRGGRGQDGGIGADGADGAKGTKRPDALVNQARIWGMFAGYSRVHTGQHQLGHSTTFIQDYSNSLVDVPFTLADLDTYGIAAGGTLPTPGKDAIPGKPPGDGGKGGDLSSNLDGLTPYAQLWGGLSGHTAGYYHGGAPAIAYAVAFDAAGTELLRCPPTPTPAGQQDTCTWPTGAHGTQPSHVRFTNPRKIAIAWGDDTLSSPPAHMEGVYGQVKRVTSKSFAYLTTAAVAVRIHFAEDAFVTGFTPLARQDLTSIAADIAGYQASSEWASLDADTQATFVDQQQKVAGLLDKLNRGVDFFGNPPGWVPALSLEANKLLFENEVDWAIRTIYLSEWLSKKDLDQQQTISTLQKSKALLEEEDVLLNQQMNAALARLPDLQTDLVRHRTAVNDLGDELKAAEQRLLQRTIDAHKVPIWKRALKVVASIAKAIPVPYVSAAGSTLDLVLNTLDGADLNDLVDAADVVGNWIDAIDPLGEAPAQAEKGKPKTADPNAEARQDRAKFREYVGKIRTFIKAQAGETAKVAGSKADLDKQIQTELDHLKEIDPEYNRIADKLKKVTNERERLASDIAATADAIEQALDKLSANFDQIAAILPAIEHAADIRLGQRARGALADMRADALLRLRKYQYLLARSFEYRMLTPYNGDLRMVNLFEQMDTLATADVDATHPAPDAQQFQTLNAAFRTDLSRIADAVADSSGGQLLTGQVDYPLDADQLARLNDGQVVDLDFWELGAFAPDEQEIRIANVRVMPDLDVAVSGAAPLSFLDIDIEHDGLSRIWSSGAMKIFRHYNLGTQTPISWTGRFKNGVLTNQPVSDAATSLLHAVLGANSANVLLFARPSAWASLRVKKNVHGAGNFDVRNLRIQIEYDYARRSSGGYASKRATQDAQIDALFQTAIGRLPSYDERRSTRERLDLGDQPVDISADLERDHPEEHFGLTVDQAFTVSFHRAPTGDERAFWAHELVLGRSADAVIADEQRILAFYGRPPTYDELVIALAQIDAGTF